MGFIHHTFSDIYANRDNWLTRLDARVKMFYLAAMLALNLFAKNACVSAAFLLFSLILLSSIRTPVLAILKSMVLPLSLAFLIMIIKGLHEGEKQWFAFSIAGLDIVFKEEGLRSGLLICGKVLGGMSLVVLLAFTTTISRLTAGLAWMRTPNTVVELISFMWRYIFLMLDEASTMRNAQKARLGYVSISGVVKSLGILGGALIMRAFDRAERTHDAMRIRGYNGETKTVFYLQPLRLKEYVLFTGVASMLPVHFYAGNMQIWL